MRYRRATREDARAIASLFRATRQRCLPYLPVLHSAVQDVAFITGVLQNDTVWVAQRDEAIVGFCAFENGRLNHLYVDAACQRTGIGTALLKIALSHELNLDVWVFQPNSSAITFYEARGFVRIAMTDGSENEEGVPDALYSTHHTGKTRFDA